ncbi:MAG TPA: heme exporter protein CcmB [Candidatus Eisenbacteria bacterium]|nr:heme exporter protein CcmB [Candidatus Eisenbacteria bacterium]HEU4764473.1 heme exporter protein CcmB [Candidatus Eisenbacteria bacterium]
MSFLAVALKDLRLYARDARFVATLLLFSASLVLILSVAFGPIFKDPAREASATLWAALFFAGVLGLTRSLDLEAESGGGDAMRLTGADPYAIYLGKTIANILILGGVFVLVLPIVSVFFDVGNLRVLPGVLGVAALGVVGYAAWGTLFAALARGLKARELLLSVLLFPSLVPLWIGAVKITHSLWAEGTAGPVQDWLKVMAVSDVLGLALAAFLYELIQEASE